MDQNEEPFFGAKEETWGAFQAAATQLSFAAFVRARMLSLPHYSKNQTIMKPYLNTKLLDKTGFLNFNKMQSTYIYSNLYTNTC